MDQNVAIFWNTVTTIWKRLIFTVTQIAQNFNFSEHVLLGIFSYMKNQLLEIATDAFVICYLYFVECPWFREGFKKKKKWYLSLWVLTPPLESDKIFFNFFLDTRQLFENFLKKMIFSPLKSQKIDCYTYNRAQCRPRVRDVGRPHTILAAHPPWILTSETITIISCWWNSKGGPRVTPGGGYPPIHEKFL